MYQFEIQPLLNSNLQFKLIQYHNAKEESDGVYWFTQGHPIVSGRRGADRGVVGGLLWKVGIGGARSWSESVRE